MNKLVIVVALLGAVHVILAAGCGGTSDASGSGSGATKLSLAAYSTPREAYAELIRAFAKTAEGRGVSISQSYGSSGEQSRAVESGLPADVVAFSLEPDVTRLVEAGIVAADWASDEHDGMVTDSVVVFAVRKGNPKRIRDWDDLVRDGVEVITPNPFTSGGARWNVMAAYGAQLKQGKSKEQAVQYLRELFANVTVQDKSARESLQTFSSGKGDVLIAYENEAITAQQAGQALDYVIPDQTILIENPVAVTKDAPGQAQAFVDFLRTPDAQRVFAEKGYRSILPEVVDERRYPTPATLFTIADLGGWETVQTEFFDRDDGVFAAIQRELGAPLE
ncbi:MAG TPA: sulfate ABC transporter substrate-binding protein [Gaiellaceae bacterium]|nr:sulfate ABC transporter substrate-binding protein [Gaiellaceae bacterium]